MLIGLNVPFAFVTGYIFAGISLMLPLAEDFRAGGFLAFLAAALICLPLGGIAVFYKFFPFIAFFGLHPLVNCIFKRRKIGKWIAFAVKEVWFVGAMCGAWAIFCAMTEVSLPFAWMYDWAYLIIAVGGAAVFFVYDWLMLRAQKLMDFYVAKIGGKGGKSAPGRGAVPSVRDDAAEVFGEELFPADKNQVKKSGEENSDKPDENKEEKDNVRNGDGQ